MRSEDAEKLAQLWTSAQHDVAAFVRSLVGPQPVADLLQQVAVQLVRNFDRYDQSLAFTPWAIGVAKNEVLAWRRKQATDRHLFDEGIVEQVADAFAKASQTQQPLNDALHDCLQEVNGRARKALSLRYGENLSTKEIAQELKMKPGTLRMLLCRVREVIRQCIQRRLTTTHTLNDLGGR